MGCHRCTLGGGFGVEERNGMGNGLCGGHPTPYKGLSPLDPFCGVAWGAEGGFLGDGFRYRVASVRCGALAGDAFVNECVTVFRQQRQLPLVASV